MVEASVEVVEVVVEEAVEVVEAKPAAKRVYVRVKPGSRWQSVMAAGTMYTMRTTEISPDSPALSELSANPYLEIAEEQWPEP